MSRKCIFAVLCTLLLVMVIPAITHAADITPMAVACDYYANGQHQFKVTKSEFVHDDDSGGRCLTYTKKTYKCKCGESKTKRVGEATHVTGSPTCIALGWD